MSYQPFEIIKRANIETHTEWGGLQKGEAIWYETYGWQFIAINYGSRSELVYSPDDLATHYEANQAFKKLVRLSQPAAK